MKKNFFKNNGITGIDLSIAVIIITIFTGVIGTLMVNSYKTTLEIQSGTYAMAYATKILEKVDEKSFDDVDDDFISYLKGLGELETNENYKIDFSTKVLEENLFKKATITVTYSVNQSEKSITINKLKIKEL